jgi:hypothetical protein
MFIVLARASPQPGRRIALFRRLTRIQIGQTSEAMRIDPECTTSEMAVDSFGHRVAPFVISQVCSRRQGRLWNRVAQRPDCRKFVRADRASF